MPPLMNQLVLIIAAAITAHLIARWSWKKGVTHGKKITETLSEKDRQLALVTGMAQVRLNDARQLDIITELRGTPRR